MNEKLYRSSPAAGKLLRPSCAPLHGHKLGFKRAPKKRLRVIDIQKFLRVSHFRKFCPGSYFTNSTVYSSVSLSPEFLSGHSFLQSSPCIVRSVIFKSCPRPVILPISPRSELWEFFFKRRNHTIFNFVREQSIYVKSRVQFTGERLSYFPLIGSFSPHMKSK